MNCYRGAERLQGGRSVLRLVIDREVRIDIGEESRLIVRVRKVLS